MTSQTLNALLVVAVTASLALAQDAKDYPASIRTVLENTKPLEHARGDRLPLLLWPVMEGVVDDVALQERIIRELDGRGVAMIATWNPGEKEKSLAASLRIAKIQKELGLRVCVNANPAMYSFFDGDERTAHLDDAGKPFFDASIPNRIGCPFRIDHRYAAMTEKIDAFVRAYDRAGASLDFVFGDWEIDGPLEINRAWEASKRCTVCRREIPGIDSFDTFQKAIRLKRADATRRCYSDPILSRYPEALVGNYGVYPHDGYRYWYDYFETFVDYHPHRMDQRAPYRRWYDDFPPSGYTFAMPVYYPWARLFRWYDFPSGDYRWFYNMLKVASNAGRHTPADVPIIPFVHWHRVFVGGPKDETITQMTERAYGEFLWHALLRGSDTFFLWCQRHEYPKEVALLHAVWADSLQHAEFLSRGTPLWFDVPATQQAVVSGVRLGSRVLVRRTDFDAQAAGPIEVSVDGATLRVPVAAGRCQVLTLGSADSP